MRSCPLKGNDGNKGHYFQQTNTETENRMPHILTYKWELSHYNIWIDRRGKTHTGSSLEGEWWEEEEDQKKELMDTRLNT